MGIMTVFGVDLPVAIDSFRITPVEVGMEQTRNANGYLVGDRRAIKNEYDFATVPRGLEEAMLYRELLVMAGDFWSLSTDAYSSKGLLITGTGGWSANTWSTAAGQTMVVPVPPANQDAVFSADYAGRSGHTLVGWRAGGTSRVFAWSWRGLEGTVTNKRERLVSGTMGPVQAYTGAETFVHDYGAQTLTVTQVGGTYGFSRLMWIPRFFGTTQLDALLTGWGANYPTDSNFYPDPPRLLVRSDLFPADQLAASGRLANRIVVASVSELKASPYMRAGTYDKNALALTVKMVEV